jgi:hypothetical protein
VTANLVADIPLGPPSTSGATTGGHPRGGQGTMMARSRALSTTTTLTIAAGLTLAATGLLGVLEQPVPVRQAVAWLASQHPDAPPGRAAETESVPAPGPALRTEQGRAPGLVPSPRPGPESETSALRAAAAPMELHVGRIDAVAPVLQVGLLPDGGMEVPADITTVGWFAVEGHTISPGDPGTAVLAGHRDSRADGPGALHALADVREGDLLRIVHVDGTVSRWQVVEIMTTPRDELPSAELFTASGTPRLAVVTCGGRFDLLRRSYTHNTIVIAHAVDRSPA